MKNIILVVTHKNVPLPEADCLKPIIVGKGDFEGPLPCRFCLLSE